MLINLRTLLVILFLPVSLVGQNDSKLIHQDFNQRFSDARFIFHKAYFEQANRMFDSLIEERSDHALSFAYASMIDMLLFRDPSKNIEKALSLSGPKNPEHLFVSALCSFAKGDYAACEKYLKDYLKDHSDDVFALHVLGFTQIDQGRPADGKNTLLGLLKSHPEYYPAYNHLGYAYLKMDDNLKAIDAFKNFLNADDANPSAHDSYAEGMGAIKEFDKAIAHLTRSTILDPEFAYAWNHMGDVFMLSGEHDLAMKAYQKAKMSSDLYGEDFINYVNRKIDSIQK